MYLMSLELIKLEDKCVRVYVYMCVYIYNLQNIISVTSDTPQEKYISV